MTDCSDRPSYPDQESAQKTLNKLVEWGKAAGVVFLCRRCDRWHFAGSHAEGRRERHSIRRERCVTDRDLHIQMARVAGVPLEELDRKFKLDTVGIYGQGVQFVSLAD